MGKMFGRGRGLLFVLFIALGGIALVSSCDALPNRVDVSEIPDYYFDNNYLDNRVEVIKEAINECKNGYETFFWITDIHWEPELNERKSPLLIKYIASKTGVDKILNGGDTGNSKVICENAIMQFRTAIGSDRLYTVTGNHEIVDASKYETPFARVADAIRGHNTDIRYGDSSGDKSYFYFNNEKEKIRFIGLSSFGLFLNGECESCYTDEQLRWFENEALNVENGWTIIIFTHTLYYINIESDSIRASQAGAEAFIDAIDNYNGNGKIACVLMGHTHRDRIIIGKTGVPYIISASDRHATYHGDINVDRIPGTISEQHFEVVVIDKERQQIKLLSIGANARDGFENEPGKEVDLRIVNY